jgi:predicted dehydrogenase
MCHSSRRTFLKISTLTAATLAFPSGVFSQSSTTPSPLRLGIIGTGHRGAVHISSIKSFWDFQIAAACDIRQNQLNAAIKRIGGSAKAFTEYQKLLDDPDLDAVLIATPNCVHKQVLLAALQANKHILCEKPMAISFDECKAMRSAASTKPDRVVLYTMQLRYSPRFAAMRKAIEQGKIGRPLYQLFVELRGDWNRRDVWEYDDPVLGKRVNWRLSHAASGGTLSEKSCHFLDLMNWMAGANPLKVRCDGGIAKYKDGRNTWDHATLVAEYPDGLKATHSLCMFGPKRMDFQIVGEEASLLVEDAGPGGNELILQSKGKRELIPLPAEIPHGTRGPAKATETAVLLMYQDFVDCVRNNKKPFVDADKAMASCKTAWLGELSSDTKKEVTWDAIG